MTGPIANHFSRPPLEWIGWTSVTEQDCGWVPGYSRMHKILWPYWRSTGQFLISIWVGKPLEITTSITTSSMTKAKEAMIIINRNGNKWVCGTGNACNGIVSLRSCTAHSSNVVCSKQLVCTLVHLLAPVMVRIHGWHPRWYRQHNENIIWVQNYLSKHHIIPLLHGSRERNITKQHGEPSSMLPWRCTSAWISNEEVKETSLEQGKEPSLPWRYCLSCLARSWATPGDEFGGLVEGAQKWRSLLGSIKMTQISPKEARASATLVRMTS